MRLSWGARARNGEYDELDDFRSGRADEEATWLATRAGQNPVAIGKWDSPEDYADQFRKDCGTDGSRYCCLSTHAPYISLEEILFVLRMLRVHVSFPSGSGETLSIPEHSKVGDLKLLAQKTFGKGFLKLVRGDGHVLTDLKESLQAAGLRDGETLTAVVQKINIASTDLAFALWCCGGSKVVAWGKPQRGGDCSAVQDQLRNVQQATHGAFAAILANGSVVTWGDPDHGGDSSVMQDQLRNLKQVQATGGAFAAILADGSVVAWGDPDDGGDCSSVQDQLRDVQQLQATYCAFAAILANGSVVTWGKRDFGGDSSAVQDQLRNVQQVQATGAAFAAILADGSVVTWGHRICRNLGQRIRGYLGPSRHWRRLLRCSR
eukprot:s551_g24.t1